WERVEGALVVRVPRTDRRALALAGELASRLPANVERARLLERRTEREGALVEAAERRLARLGFDLHDGPVQEIMALGAELRLFREQLRRTLGGHRQSAIILGRVDDLEARLVALDGELREGARRAPRPRRDERARPPARGPARRREQARRADPRRRDDPALAAPELEAVTQRRRARPRARAGRRSASPRCGS